MPDALPYVPYPMYSLSHRISESENKRLEINVIATISIPEGRGYKETIITIDE